MTTWQDRVAHRTVRVAIVGLGYVGLPLTQAATHAGWKVYGLDLSQPLVDALGAGRILALDLALQFRRDILKPFFDQYLVPGAPKADTPPVLVYDTGANRWDRLQAWPQSCAKGCAATSKPC